MLLLLSGLAVLFLSRPLWVPTGFLNFSLDGLAWVFFALYITFRLWATLYIAGRKDEYLQTQGPYSITRNPLYLGSFCLALSVSLFLKSLTTLFLTGIVGFIYTQKIVKIEEVWLEKKFGEKFKAYCRSTPRFLPSWKRYHSDDFMNIEISGLKSESRRLGASILIPIAAQMIIWFRLSPRWPHLFPLP